MNVEKRSFFAKLSPLTIAKFGLAIFILGMPIVQKQAVLWPIIGWPMFSSRDVDYPPNATSALTMIAIGEDASRHPIAIDRLRSALFPPGRESVSQKIVSCAAWSERAEMRNECRQYLFTQVSLLFPKTQIANLEVWRTEWAVDPLARPPLDRSAPRAKEMVARIAATAASKSEPGK